jgi:hypothetical protein
MPIALVKSLHIYPIKSCRGIEVTTLNFGVRGPRFDREWMIVDRVTGKFLSQREIPALTKVIPRISENSLSLRIGIPQLNDRLAELEISLAIDSDPNPSDRPSNLPRKLPDEPASHPIEVSVWESRGPMAVEEATAVSQAFSDFVQRPVRFVRMAKNYQRRMKSKYGFQDRSLSFVDDMPTLLVSMSSLRDLNVRLPEPIAIDQFRPNIVIDDAPGISAKLSAFAEDHWQQIHIGQMLFDATKSCTRCIIVTTNQHTAERNPEVLKVLASYRRDENSKVVFGRYLVHGQNGVLRVGDPVILGA